MREALSRLLKSVGLRSRAFDSARGFLDAELEDTASCLLLDVRMPGLSGLEVQEALEGRDAAMPIIFVTGHGNIPMSVRAMKSGAVDFLTKPFDEQELLDAVNQALDRDRAARRERAELESIRERLDRLTPRERQVFELVVTGLLNRQVAERLGTSEKTIKVHRARVMDKMNAGSLAELVQLAGSLGIV